MLGVGVRREEGSVRLAVVVEDHCVSLHDDAATAEGREGSKRGRRKKTTSGGVDGRAEEGGEEERGVRAEQQSDGGRGGEGVGIGP